MSGDLTHAPGDKLKPKPPVEAPNFTGMTKASFRQYWLRRPDMWPLMFMNAAAALFLTWTIAREVSLNPKYRFKKSRRESAEVDHSEADVERYKASPFMAHWYPHRAFSLLGVSFRPCRELEADKRAKRSDM